MHARVLVIDEDTKKRAQQLTTTFVHLVYIMIVNYGIRSMHGPLLSRMIGFETKKPDEREPSESVTNYMRRSSVESGGQFYDILQQHHCIDAMHMVLSHCCNAGSLFLFTMGWCAW